MFLPLERVVLSNGRYELLVLDRPVKEVDSFTLRDLERPVLVGRLVVGLIVLIGDWGGRIVLL